MLVIPAVPDFDSFYANFIDTNNPNNSKELASPDVQKTLRPNASLDDARRLFTKLDVSNQNALTLTSSGVFQTSTTIGGVYMCLANNSFGSRNETIKITVERKGENELSQDSHYLCTNDVIFPYSCKW